MNKLSGEIVNIDDINEFISSKNAIKYRYGEIEDPTINQAMKYYLDALNISTELTSSLKREIVFDNASFKLKRPPWTIKRPYNGH